ncbi:MAG: hypothetical protein U0871_01205 [Gemmataceae bacterium]
MASITVTLQTDTEQRLRAKAAAEGQTIETYLAGLADREAEDGGGPDPLAEATKQLSSRTPEEVLAARERILVGARRGRPLPPGKTVFDMVEGTWPGDETDEEIRQALEEIS